MHLRRADEHIRAAWFIDHSAAEVVVPFAEHDELVRYAPAAELRPAAQHHARRLAAGVGVDDGNALRMLGSYVHSREMP